MSFFNRKKTIKIKCLKYIKLTNKTERFILFVFTEKKPLEVPWKILKLIIKKTIIHNFKTCQTQILQETLSWHHKLSSRHPKNSKMVLRNTWNQHGKIRENQKFYHKTFCKTREIKELVLQVFEFRHFQSGFENMSFWLGENNCFDSEIQSLY